MERKAREKNAARLDADEKSKRKGMVDKTIDEINESSYSRVQLELLYLAHRVARGDGCAYRDVAYSFGSLAGSLATMFPQFIAFSVIGDEQALRSGRDRRRRPLTMGQDDAPHNFRFAYERAAAGCCSGSRCSSSARGWSRSTRSTSCARS